jgi:uncharacterized protein with PIN domain
VVFLDAFPLIAVLLAEESAPAVERLLREQECATTSVNLAEAIDVCCRTRRLAPQVVDEALGLLLDETVRVLAPGVPEARRAALIRASYYKARRAEVSLADCFLLAAPAAGDEIATPDPAVLSVARDLGIPTISLD